MGDIASLADKLGLIGVVVVMLLYQVFYLQKKLVSIIENNTSAMGKLTSTIEKCQISHQD